MMKVIVVFKRLLASGKYQGNRWNILGFKFTKEMRYLVYIRYLCLVCELNVKECEGNQAYFERLP
jgi:uncharacterized protein YfbU (UPF0304 family)